MRRSLLTMLVAAVVAAGCVVAGVWQWHRHWDRTAQAELVDANYDADAVALDRLLTPGLARDDTWRPAAVTGRYVDTLVLRGRPVAGGPAVHDLGVVEVTEGALCGRRLVVDRGWLRVTPEEGLPAMPEHPDGAARLVVRLRPLEDASGRPAARGEVYGIAARDLAAAGEPDVLPAYGVVATEDGAPPRGLSPVTRPEISLGVNLSYAIQWWFFALGSLVGGVLLVRQRDAALDEEAEDADAPAPRAGDAGPQASGPAPLPARRRPSRTRHPTAEEEEDALLEAQERVGRSAPRPPAGGPAANPAQR